MQGIHVKRIQRVKEVTILEEITQTIIHGCNTSVHVTPQPFYPLIMDRAANKY